MPSKTKPTQPATEPKERKPETYYQLATFEDGDERELLQLTADQFAALKAHLATLKSTPPVTSFRAYTAAADERVKVINNLLGGLDGIKLLQLETVRLMTDRTRCGINDPISKFICDLIFHYGRREEEGLGLTIEDVESELAELRENMSEALSEAHFIAGRYPRRESHDAEARS